MAQVEKAYLLLVSFLLISVVNTHLSDSILKSNNQIEKRRHDSENRLEAILSVDSEEKCYGRRCVHSNHCCPGSVCVDINQIAGTCLPIYGLTTSGNYCKRNEDCLSGEHCKATATTTSQQPLTELESSLKTCQPASGKAMRKKQYNDQCLTSIECDATRGLCCQLIKRYRLSPKKLCYYFVDPKACLGPLDVSDIKPFYGSPPARYQNALFRARLG